MGSVVSTSIPLSSKEVALTHLWSLRLDFASTGEGAVNFTHGCEREVCYCGSLDDGIWAKEELL